MRKCLTISLLLVAAMIVGCQTQSWRDTDRAPGAGRDADTPWQVHGGLIELTGSLSAGFGAVDDQDFGDYNADIEAVSWRGSLFGGYMINDYFELGAFFEYTWGTWDIDQTGAGEIDVTGWAIGPKLIYNFSNVGTDVVPYVSVAGGWGSVDAEYDDEEDDGDQAFAQLGFGIRFFAWDGIAWNLEGYYRYQEWELDELEETVRESWEFGLILSASVWF